MILVINCGSSSIKFACYKLYREPERILSGEISKIGLPAGRLSLQYTDSNNSVVDENIDVSSFSLAILQLEKVVEKHINFDEMECIGHRIVHGMAHTSPELITASLIGYLQGITKYDPSHLPFQLELIEYFLDKFSPIRQYACYDTEFHKSIPRKASLLPVQRRFQERGFHRYGFHGLSYEYLMIRLRKLVGENRANGRVIIAHLGNGASLSAISGGSCIDTTMSFTPGSGIPMSTRSGDLDPGVVCAIMKEEHLEPDEFNSMINREAGLIGISGTTGDVQQLLAAEASDLRAAEALTFFCYNVKKAIGALSAALGGLDILIFSGGIGENSAVIRSRICSGLEFLGIILDDPSNSRNNIKVSGSLSHVDTFVLHADEEWMIASKIMSLQSNAN